MTRDQELLQTLNDLVDAYRARLNSSAKKICHPQVKRLQGSLNVLFHISPNKHKDLDLSAPLLDVLQTMQNIMQEIDQEKHSLEKEMQGVQNYSNYEYEKIINFSYKKEFKELLIKMREMIFSVYPTLQKQATFAKE